MRADDLLILIMLFVFVHSLQNCSETPTNLKQNKYPVEFVDIVRREEEKNPKQSSIKDLLNVHQVV